MSAINFLTLLLVKHFFADWFFQSDTMAQKKGTEPKWLLAHVLIHLLGTTLVLIFYLPVITLFLVLLSEFVVHGALDWIKSRPELSKRFPMPSHNFWVLIGADQLAHQLYYLAITAFLMGV